MTALELSQIWAGLAPCLQNENLGPWFQNYREFQDDSSRGLSQV